MTIGGVAQHLISYYKVEDVESGRLRSPSSLPELASLDISPEYLDKTHFRNPPKVELGPDGILRYRGEADDIDTSPPLLTAPLSGLPLLTDGRVTDNSTAAIKRSKRYDPYTSPTVPKRSRKHTKGSPEASSSTEPQAPREDIATPAPQPPANYPDPNLSAVAPPAPYPHYGVPPYYQVPGYPVPHPHIFPPAPGPYPPGAVPPPILPHQGPAQYPGHSAPSSSNNGMNDPSSIQQTQYYPYYPPPHPTYSGYPGVAWPFPSYPPQPMPHILPPPMPDGENKTDGSKDGAADNGLDT